MSIGGSFKRDVQGSSIKEIEEALKTASKKGTGTAGRPDFTAVVKDFVLVIEDKADLDKHIALKNNVISTDTYNVTNYAVNGAYHYAKHIAQNTKYTKVIAIGISGDEKTSLYYSIIRR